MARTKQTARRSTGAIAPQVHLSAPASHIAPDDVQVIPARRSRRTKSSTRTTAKAAVEAASKQARKASTTRKRADPGKAASPSSLPDGHDKFCGLCENGGVSAPCYKCPRVVCIAHLPDLQALDSDTLAELDFMCPSCHIVDTRDARAHGQVMHKAPYMALYRKDGTAFLDRPADLDMRFVVSRHARVNTTKTWVVHLCLRPLRGETSVPYLLYKAMQQYFVEDEQDNLVYIEVDFNLNTNADAERHVKKIRQSLREVADSSPGRVLFFIHTHSHDEDGTLFFGEDLAAQSLRNWFDILLPADVRVCLRTHDTTMFMLACGALVHTPRAYEELKEHYESLGITRLLAFEARAFQPSLALPFFNAYVTKFLFENVHFSDVHLGNILTGSQYLGRHSRVIVMSTRNNAVEVAEYFWSHPKIRPGGIVMPMQCPVCKALDSFKITVVGENGPTHIKCKEPGCAHSYVYKVPTGHVQVLSGVEGQWNKRTRN